MYSLLLLQEIHLDLDQPKFSSSAVDTGGFLLQLGNFWKNLEWPIATDAIGYLCIIIEVSKSGTLTGHIQYFEEEGSKRLGVPKEAFLLPW